MARWATSGSSRILLRVLLATTAALAMSLASAAAQSDGWNIPADADALRSPLEQTPALVARGRTTYASRCQRCHGPEGRGDGPASDPKRPAANLTDPAIANSDGVLFYKVWNGKRPMPAFKSELTRDEVWAVVAFVRTLSAAPAAGRQGAGAP